MTPESWIAFGGLMVTGLIYAGVSFVQFGRMQNAIITISDAVKNKVSKEEGAGFQAQLNRLERNDAECDAKIVMMREEANTRAERVNGRVEIMEQRHADANANVQSQLATLTATTLGLKEAFERFLEAQSRQAPLPVPQQPNPIEQLRMLVELQTLMKKMV